MFFFNYFQLLLSKNCVISMISNGLGNLTQLSPPLSCELTTRNFTPQKKRMTPYCHKLKFVNLLKYSTIIIPILNFYISMYKPNFGSKLATWAMKKIIIFARPVLILDKLSSSLIIVVWLARPSLSLQVRGGSGIMPYAVLFPMQEILRDNQIAELRCVIMCH